MAKTKKKVAKAKPKRPLTPFLLWMNAKRNELKRKHPKLTASELMKVAVAEWTNLEDKSEWEQAAKGGTGELKASTTAQVEGSSTTDVPLPVEEKERNKSLIPPGRKRKSLPSPSSQIAEQSPSDIFKRFKEYERLQHGSFTGSASANNNRGWSRKSNWRCLTGFY